MVDVSLPQRVPFTATDPSGLTVDKVPDVGAAQREAVLAQFAATRVVLGVERWGPEHQSWAGGSHMTAPNTAFTVGDRVLVKRRGDQIVTVFPIRGSLEALDLSARMLARVWDALYVNPSP